MRCDVFTRETLDVHELHDRLRHRVLDAEVRHRVDETLVQGRGPHQSRAFQRLRVILLAAVHSHLHLHRGILAAALKRCKLRECSTLAWYAIMCSKDTEGSIW